jgi:trigger factor
MVDDEYERIFRNFEAEVGETVDAELDIRLHGIAERRIRLAILLTEIGQVHGIRTSRAEIEALVEREAERHPEHQAEIIDYYLDHPTALAELQAPLFEESVVAFLLERNDIEEVDASKEELRHLERV